jgi:MoaA/NifB/PqqE/SkfB family radical SAM enzyme
MMALAEVRRHLEESVRLGVKELYFTGGEPLMNRELAEILEAALRVGPATVLTNGLLIDERRARRFRVLCDGSVHSLDFRLSLDGYDAATHDAIRGHGMFDRALAGARHLAAAGFNPVFTVTEVRPEIGEVGERAAFLARLRELGFPHPRLKLLPVFRLGRERERTGPYRSCETLRGRTLCNAKAEALQCSSSRMVTTKGVYVCPILVDRDDAIMGSTLAETLRPFALSHAACYTCQATGMSCRT